MYPAQFDYVRAKSVAEAGDLLAMNPAAKLLAGGHSLIPILKLRLASPPLLIDIGRIGELKGISVSGGRLRIGALTTHADVAASGDVRKHASALADAASQIGDPAVRNRGTVGGNIAHADPASDLPAVLSALDATVLVTGAGGASRSIAARDFFLGMMTTALGPGEILTAVEVPAQPAGGGSAYVKLSHPASRYAVIGAAVWVRMDGGRCAAASVVLSGVAPAPARARAVEAALAGQALTPDVVVKAASATAGDLSGDLLGDLYASATYRKSVAHVYVRRAIAIAAERSR
jgi:carbon-monoxide dehydrogenase medium subunit